MNEDRQPPIERHLTEEELNGAIDEAEQADEPRLVRCLGLERPLAPSGFSGR